jgi:hypothetical protein
MNNLGLSAIKKMKKKVDTRISFPYVQLGEKYGKQFDRALLGKK